MIPSNDYILIKGATENNLKNLSLSISKRQITVVTGVSGSGDFVIQTGIYVILQKLSEQNG